MRGAGSGVVQADTLKAPKTVSNRALRTQPFPKTRTLRLRTQQHALAAENERDEATTSIGVVLAL